MKTIYIDNVKHHIFRTLVHPYNWLELTVGTDRPSSSVKVRAAWFANPDGTRIYTGGHWYSAKPNTSSQSTDKPVTV